jgi:hypothetical protein
MFSSRIDGSFSRMSSQSSRLLFFLLFPTNFYALCCARAEATNDNDDDEEEGEVENSKNTLKYRHQHATFSLLNKLPFANSEETDGLSDETQTRSP